VEQFDKPRANGRGFFRRFEQHRIAGDQRRHDMAVRQMRGEIIGAEDGKRAVRLVAHRVAQPHRAFDPAVGGAFGIGLDRDIDLVRDRFDLGPRFPQRFAGLARDQIGELFAIGLHPVGKAAQRFGAEGDGLRGPSGPGGARGCNFGVDVTDTAAP
jgi:hypothetical protein